MNDISDRLEGDVNVGWVIIKFLAFADDIVLLAQDRLTLQRMINEFERYCQKWDLVVNLDKSKVVISRNGGKPARREKYYFNNQRIEVVNRYKYLGIVLTSGLSLHEHFREKATLAKFALCSLD